MKKDYQKPTIEIITFNYDVLTVSAGGGDSEKAINVGEKWYDKK